jgi:hypothetical protein
VKQGQVRDLQGEIGDVLKPEIQRLKDEAEAARGDREDMQRRVDDVLKELENKKVIEKQLKEVEAESKS